MAIKINKNTRNFSLLLLILLIIAAAVGLVVFDQLRKPSGTKTETTKSAEEKTGIIVFLKDNATTRQAKSLQKELEAIDGVSSSKYISKEDAYQLYKEKYKDEPLVLKFATADILPASIEVYFTDFKNLNDAEALLKSKDFVAQVIKTYAATQKQK